MFQILAASSVGAAKKTSKRQRKTTPTKEIEINLGWLALALIVVVFVWWAYLKLKTVPVAVEFTNVSGYPMFVPVTLDNSPVKGDVGQASVVVFEFSDPSCPVCQKFVLEYSDLINKYVSSGHLALVSKYFVAVPSHKTTSEPGVAALECVKQQAPDAYWGFRSELYKLYSEKPALYAVDKLKEDLIKLAQRYVPNVDNFKTCVDSEESLQSYKRDQDYVINTIAVVPLPKEYKTMNNVNAFATNLADVGLGTPMFVFCHASTFKENKQACVGYPVVGLMQPEGFEKIITDLINAN